MASDVVEIEAVDATTDRAVVTARTVQDAEYGPDGATCSDWSITYTLVLSEGYWQNDAADLTDGRPPVPCETDGPSPPALLVP